MKTINKIILLSITIALFIGNANAQNNEDAKKIQKLNDFFSILEKNNKIMGSFSVQKEGKLFYTKQIGYSDISKNTKINATTKFRIGSTTKLFTATLIFQLIEKGKLSLNTKLATFYPEIPNANEITIEMLLNHKSGLYDFVNDFATESNNPEGLTKYRGENAIIQGITTKSPKLKPNEKTNYNNSGYFLLTRILEKTTNKKYAALLESNICKKINLQNTYSPSDNKLKDNEAVSYIFANDKWTTIDEIYFTDVIGVGDILSTPQDLIVFNESITNGKLLSNESLIAMKKFSGQIYCTGMMKLPFYEYTGYGHSGDTFATHTVMGTFENEKTTIAFSINGENFATNQISIALLGSLFNKDFTMPDFNSIEINDKIITSYEGVYGNKEIGLDVTMSKNGKKLIAQATGQPSFEVQAVNNTTFKSVEIGIEFVFDIEKGLLIMNQGKQTFKFLKK